MLNILTLNWQGKEKLERLYPSLINSLNNIEYKWFIKDNGSTDGSASLIEGWNNPHIYLMKCNHNRDNFSLGCNLLFKESKSNHDDLILLLNNDIIFNDHNSLNNMITIIQNDEVGVVGAKLKFTNTNTVQHAGVVFIHSISCPSILVLIITIVRFTL